MARSAQEVGRLVSERRTELGMDASRLARLAGVDPKTLISLERGERWPRDVSRSRIERALHWKMGSLTRLAEGADAVLEEPDQADDPGLRADVTTAGDPAGVLVLLNRIAHGQLDEPTRQEAQRLLDDMNVEHLGAVIDALSRDGRLEVYHVAAAVYEREHGHPFSFGLAQIAARQERDYPKRNGE